MEETILNWYRKNHKLDITKEEYFKLKTTLDKIYTEITSEKDISIACKLFMKNSGLNKLKGLEWLKEMPVICENKFNYLEGWEDHLKNIDSIKEIVKKSIIKDK